MKEKDSECSVEDDGPRDAFPKMAASDDRSHWLKPDGSTRVGLRVVAMRTAVYRATRCHRLARLSRTLPRSRSCALRESARSCPPKQPDQPARTNSLGAQWRISIVSSAPPLQRKIARSPSTRRNNADTRHIPDHSPRGTPITRVRRNANPPLQRGAPGRHLALRRPRAAQRHNTRCNPDIAQQSI